LGEPTAEAIVMWVNKNSNPLIIKIDDCDALSMKLSYSTMSLVYFGKSTGEMYYNFVRAARVKANFLFYAMSE